ncbi:DUF885 domain-containing protein [Phycicoccus sp. 3266]|uniref:DUF885 domain-containing protein n=1 Tax=Phycicoccus sp. 3266 TaxID=2817751 RepID=UPI00285D3D04|nr:DUF885 domain-containing protein [Phycicoccus sp. 3266]MDR6862314.1 uncharacterized protein (DUF885 family) [Phycicoccus sp. 3266]
MTTETTPRPATDIDRIADEYLSAVVTLSPITATYLGIPGHEEELDDFSPAGHEAHAELRRETLSRLEAASPVDDIDRVTLAAMRERLGLAEETHAAGLDEMALNVIASPLQEVRGCFDLMATATDEDWGVISRRMEKVPAALEQWKQSLLAAAGKGNVAPRRQVEACIQQCADLTAGDGYFATLLKDARLSDGEDDGDLSEGTRAGLAAATQAASAAYGELGTWLRENLLDRAPEADACGRERYSLLSRSFLGATVDLEETYRWGQAEVAQITARMEEVAERIKPGATVKEAIAALDADPAYQLHGTDALKAWMQERADEVIANLAGTHFDIPDPVRTIECLIAPTQTGGIYYTGPSEDFSRPGRMWWSVPKGVTEFGTWKELTTVYHEGVPGHHLQVAQTVFRSELLNSWRRMAAWTSGHGEGWALYAERLMEELGYMDDPGNLMGLLDSQSLRAARVVIDIGVHCGFEAPEEVGGGEWTYDKAWQYLTAHANQGEAWLRFELDRYLGWPGQAPSYKIGERLWMQLRDQVREREGESFSLKDFHRRALDIGGVGLDTLREAVLGELG